MEEATLTYKQLMNLFLEIRESQKDTEKKFQETAVRFKETDKKFQDTDKKFQDTDLKFKETAIRFQETDILLKRVSEDIGHLGNKFGSFNEALVIPSLEKLFEEHFNCKSISQNQKILMNGNSFEIDMLAYSNDSCYIIEIKSKFRKDDLKQLLKHIEKFRLNSPEHENKKLFGVIVATEFNKDNIKELEKNGIYFISITDNLIKLHESNSFTPKSW